MAEYSGKDKRLAYLFEAVENVQVDDMTGASASTDGAHGLVPTPLAGDEDKYLRGDGTWAAVQAGAGALSGLSDVDLSSPTDGQALVYDGENDVWVNGNVSGGGGSGAPMKVYEGAWIATSSSSDTTQLTDALSLPAGKYLIVVCSPYSVSSGTFGIYLNINGVTVENEALVESFSASGSLFVSVQTLTTDSTVYAMPIVSAPRTWDSAYLNRGYIKAIALSQPQTALIYSEEEREVGVWTDGKPLYQKTVHFGAVAAGTINYQVTMGLSNVDEVAFTLCTVNNISGVWITLPRSLLQSSSTFAEYGINQQGYTISTDKFRIDTGSSVAIQEGYVTIQYTKTTDTAGSGTWTTTGEYAHHYSTSEKVIGTWIDGKPLYEKCIMLNSRIAIATNYTTVIDSTIHMRNLISATVLDNNGGTDYSLLRYIIGRHEVLLNNSGDLIVNAGASGFQMVGIIVQYTKMSDYS